MATDGIERKPPAGKPTREATTRVDLPLERVLQGIVESLSTGLIVFDLELRYVLWNPFMERLSGLESHQVLGRHPSELFPHITEHGIDELLERALGGETVESDDVPFFVPATGRAGWIVGKYLPYRDRDGRIAGVVALVRDVTDRKRTEAALAASERDLALHNAVAEIFLTTPDDEMYEKVLEVVLGALESEIGIFGYLDEDGSLVVPSMTSAVLDRCDMDDGRIVFPREMWAGSWGEALSSRRSVLANRPGSVPPGHIAISRSIFVPIAHHGEVVGLLAVANRRQDYTASDLRELEGIAGHIGPILHARLARDRLEEDRRITNRALAASEARYRAIVQQQTEFVARFLPDMTLTFVNDALCSYSGSTREELIGRSLSEFLPPEEQGKVERHLATLMPDRPVGTNEISWVTPAGETRWVSFVNHAFFDEDGALSEYQSVGRDVTDRHEHERELERALAEKEILLKEIHHRVKNNMAVISSLLSLHERDIADASVREVFQSMRSRIHSMALVHEQIYRSGDFEHVDLGSYVDQVTRTLAQSHQHANGRIQFEREVDTVTLDLERAIPCGLIVTELLSNALKHAFPGGRRGTVRISLLAAGPSEVELVVEDDGVGDVTSDAGGFGLHMVELLVRQLDGSIAHEIEGGRRVRVRFPTTAG